MATDLKTDKDRADARYRAARNIGKILAELPKEDVPVVVHHVAVEYGLVVALAPVAP